MQQVKEALAAGGHTLAVEAWTSSPFFSKTIVEPAAGKRFSAIADDYTFWHFAHADPQKTLKPNAAGRVADIRVPTLIVAGERDLAACLELADMLAKSIPGSCKVVIAGAGHLMQMEQPEKFNQVASAFVSRTATTEARWTHAVHVDCLLVTEAMNYPLRFVEAARDDIKIGCVARFVPPERRIRDVIGQLHYSRRLRVYEHWRVG